jgi:hypothetical protein
MFPIRSLTPQQATGNALAAGFNSLLLMNVKEFTYAGKYILMKRKNKSTHVVDDY